MCSTERNPSRVASARSLVVTSFCQSTKAMEPVAPPGCGRAPANAPMGGSEGALLVAAVATSGEPALLAGPLAKLEPAVAALDPATRPEPVFAGTVPVVPLAGPE